MPEPTQPTNSIDSELEQILRKLEQKIIHDLIDMEANADLSPTDFVPESLQAITAKYVSRKEIEEAIGEDVLMKDGSPVNHTMHKYRQKLRAKLLPPTKGDNE